MGTIAIDLGSVETLIRISIVRFLALIDTDFYYHGTVLH